MICIDDLKWKGLIYKGVDYSNRFLISNYGDVYSLVSHKILKKTIHENGYYQICVSLGSRNNKKVIKPHIAVAYNFVDGYQSGLVVNHKDCNKLRNYYMNLEWVTAQDNTVHAIKNGKHIMRPVRCVETGEVFPSIKLASVWAGLSPRSGSIFSFLNGNGKSAGRHPITGERLTWESA